MQGIEFPPQGEEEDEEAYCFICDHDASKCVCDERTDAYFEARLDDE